MHSRRFLQNLKEILDSNDSSLFCFARLCLVDHVHQFVLGHVFAKLTRYSLQILQRDVVFVFWEENKRLFKLSFVISLWHFGDHNVKEVLVIYLYDSLFFFVAITVLSIIVKIWNQLFDLLLSRLESQRS